MIDSHRQLASIPNHLKEAPVDFDSRDYLSFAGTTRKTNCARAILLSTLTSNLLPLPCFLTSPLRDVIVQHLRASKKSHLFFLCETHPFILHLRLRPKITPNPRPLPKISEPQCLSLRQLSSRSQHSSRWHLAPHRQRLH